ncbi:MAG: STAS-like domain-containing protein [Bacteroidaceae bacterium]|nr:STAS-like domain-containing protein [Bacteroidaceae bacterium]
MNIIKVCDFVTLNQAVTPDEGEIIYNKIISYIGEGNIVILDFSDIQLMTTAFLNTAIGNLYKDYSSEQLNGLLKLENLQIGDSARVKKVVDNAKKFYANTVTFNKNVDDAIYGKG